MSFVDGIYRDEKPAEDDIVFLEEEPISRKRMDLLWLDPPRLAQVKELLGEHEAVSIVLGDATELREHEYTQEDYRWAKQIEAIIDKAFEAGQNGNYLVAILHYKEALRLAPGCDLFLMSVGACYAQLGYRERALRYLERAAAISPGNTRILGNLEEARKL